MNMMGMANMEEALDRAWNSALRSGKLKPFSDSTFADGFRAGVAWVLSQAKIQASSPAVGNISQYRGEAEEPEEEL